MRCGAVVQEVEVVQGKGGLQSGAQGQLRFVDLETGGVLAMNRAQRLIPYACSYRPKICHLCKQIRLGLSQIMWAWTDSEKTVLTKVRASDNFYYLLNLLCGSTQLPR